MHHVWVPAALFHAPLAQQLVQRAGLPADDDSQSDDRSDESKDDQNGGKQCRSIRFSNVCLDACVNGVENDREHDGQEDGAEKGPDDQKTEVERDRRQN
jgi:hypothetical protein